MASMSEQRTLLLLVIFFFLEIIFLFHNFGYCFDLDFKTLEFEIILRYYRLDIGEGKEVNLERCPRSKLQLQCIKYLGPVRFH